MKKESKILNQLVKLTQSGEITWKIRKIPASKSSDLLSIYSTVYSITGKKSIKIYYTIHQNDTWRDNIIFNYIDDNINSKMEVKEVYPFNKFSVFDRMRIKWILSKLHKNIDNTNPKAFNIQNY